MPERFDSCEFSLVDWWTVDKETPSIGQTDLLCVVQAKRVIQIRNVPESESHSSLQLVTKNLTLEQSYFMKNDGSILKNGSNSTSASSTRNVGPYVGISVRSANGGQV